MTSSRYKGTPVAKAGERFGLTLENLEELFDLRAGSAEDMVGDQFQGLPLTQVKTTEKGRGGALSFKAPRTPTAMKTYGALEGRGNVVATGGSMGDINIGPLQQQQQPQPPKDTRPGISSSFGQSPEFFGHEDYFRNLEAGYSPTEIKEFVGKNVGLLRGENVPGQGGLYDQLMRGSVPTTGFSGDALRQQQQMSKISSAYGESPDFFGQADLDAARQKGVADTDVKKFLDQNIAMLRGTNVPGGGGVYDVVSGARSSSPAAASQSSQISTAYGDSPEFFGHKDLEAARAKGQSDESIRNYLQSNKNLLRGTNVPGGGGLYDELFKR
jgi:hypothetical protein